jgi:hypothetical protein
MTDAKGLSDEQTQRTRKLMTDIGVACSGVPNDVVASALIAMLNQIIASSTEPSKSLEFVIATLRRAEDQRGGMGTSQPETGHGPGRIQ